MQAAKVLWQSMLWRGLYYVSAFVINILIARHFQASVSGSIYFISSIYAMVLLFSSLSFESGIIYFAAKEEIPASRLFSFTLIWSLLIGLITYLVVSVFFKEAYQHVSPTLLLFSSVLYISGNLLITYCSGFFYAKNNFKVPNIIIMTGTLILIILIPFNGKSVITFINDENYFYVYFGSFFVQGVIMAIAVGINFVKKVRFSFLSLADFKLIFRYCGLAFAGNIIFFLLYRVDYLFVEKYCSARDLGNYIQVSKLVHLFFILPTILASVVFPMTAGGKDTGIIKLLPILSRSIFLCYLLVCLALLATGKSLFPYLFGNSFSEMYEPFLFVIPGILALSGIFTITAYFAGKNMIKYNIIGSVLALLVILIGDIIFIPRFGVNAAAAVSSVGYIVYQIYVVVIINRQFKSKISDFYILRKLDYTIIKNYLKQLKN